MNKHKIVVFSSLLLALTNCTNKVDHQRHELLNAIEIGDTNTVGRLILSGCDISKPNNWGYKTTPLMWAIINEKRDVIDMLLRAGANPNEKNMDGESALILAICGGDKNADIIELLISFNADIRSRDNLGASIYSYAKSLPPKPMIIDILRKNGIKE